METNFSDKIRFLYSRHNALYESINTLRGVNQSLVNRLDALELALKELQEQRELDRAKLIQLNSQMLDVTSSQIEVLTGGLNSRLPEPAEAISALAGHAGSTLFQSLASRIIAASLSVFALGIASIPIILQAKEPLLIEIPTPMRTAR